MVLPIPCHMDLFNMVHAGQEGKRESLFARRSYSPLLSNQESDTASPLSCAIRHSKFQVYSPRGEDYTKAGTPAGIQESVCTFLIWPDQGYFPLSFAYRSLV